jgi:pimeloyl-[acyl-carrier protein] synthase
MNLCDFSAKPGYPWVAAAVTQPERHSARRVAGTHVFGMPTEDHHKLKDWSQDFAEMLGNFQHNPGRATRVLASVEAMTTYFREAVRRQATDPTEGLFNALATAEVDGDRLTEEEVVANVIVTMVGGQETTTNLIGNGP